MRKRIRTTFTVRWFERSVRLALLLLLLSSFFWVASDDQAAPQWDRTANPVGISENIVLNDVTTGYDRLASKQYEAWAVGTDNNGTPNQPNDDRGVLYFYDGAKWTPQACAPEGNLDCQTNPLPPLTEVEAVNAGGDKGWHVVAAGVKGGNAYTVALRKNGDTWEWRMNSLAGLGSDIAEITGMTYDHGRKLYQETSGNYFLSVVRTTGANDLYRIACTSSSDIERCPANTVQLIANMPATVRLEAISFPDAFHGWGVGNLGGGSGDSRFFRFSTSLTILSCPQGGVCAESPWTVTPINYPPMDTYRLTGVKALLQPVTAGDERKSRVWITGHSTSLGQSGIFVYDETTGAFTASTNPAGVTDPITSLAVVEEIAPAASGEITNLVVNPTFDADRSPPIAGVVDDNESRRDIPYGWFTSRDVQLTEDYVSSAFTATIDPALGPDGQPNTARVQGRLRQSVGGPRYFLYRGSTDVDNNHQRPFSASCRDGNSACDPQITMFIAWDNDLATTPNPWFPSVIPPDNFAEVLKYYLNWPLPAPPPAPPPLPCYPNCHRNSSVRIQGFIDVPAGGATITLEHDEGARLFIDDVQNGHQVYERWGPLPGQGLNNNTPGSFTTPQPLLEGLHPFRIDYQHGTDDDGVLALRWSANNLPPCDVSVGDDFVCFKNLKMISSKVSGDVLQPIPGSDVPGKAYRVSGWVKVDTDEALYPPAQPLGSSDHPLYHYPCFNYPCFNGTPSSQPHAADSLNYAGLFARCSGGITDCGYGNTFDGTFEDDQDWRRVSFTVSNKAQQNASAVLEVGCTAQQGFTAWCDDIEVQELPLRESQTVYHVWAVTDQGKTVYARDTFANPGAVWSREQVPSDDADPDRVVPLTAVAAAAPHQAWAVGGDLGQFEAPPESENNGPFFAKLTPGNVIGWGWFGSDACRTLKTAAETPATCVPGAASDPERQTPIGWVNFSCSNTAGACTSRPFGFGVNVKLGPEGDGDLGTLTGEALVSVTGNSFLSEEVASRGVCLRDNFGPCNTATIDVNDARYSRCEGDLTKICANDTDCLVNRCSNALGISCTTDAECRTACGATPTTDLASCTGTGWLSFDRSRAGTPPGSPPAPNATYSSTSQLLTGWARLNVGQCSEGRCASDPTRPCTDRVYCAAALCQSNVCSNTGSSCSVDADCVAQDVQCNKTACYQDDDCRPTFGGPAATCDYPGGKEGWVKLRSDAVAGICNGPPNAGNPCLTEGECFPASCVGPYTPPAAPISDCQYCTIRGGLCVANTCVNTGGACATDADCTTCKVCSDNRGYQGTTCANCQRRCLSLDPDDLPPAGGLPECPTGAPNCSYWGKLCDDAPTDCNNGTTITGNNCTNAGRCYGGTVANYTDPSGEGKCFVDTDCADGQCRGIGAECASCGGDWYRYGVSLDYPDGTGFFKGYAYSEDLGYLNFDDVQLGGSVFLQTKLGDIYSGGDIGGPTTQTAPLGQFNGSFLIAANGRIQNFSTEACPGCTPTDPPPPIPFGDPKQFLVENFGRLVFPGFGKCSNDNTVKCTKSTDCPGGYCDKVNQSVLGSLDYHELIKRDSDNSVPSDAPNRYGTVYQTVNGSATQATLLDPQDRDGSGTEQWDDQQLPAEPGPGKNRVCLNGYIWHIKGNLTIDKQLHFANNQEDGGPPNNDCGAGRNGTGLVIVDGNLNIQSNLFYDQTHVNILGGQNYQDVSSVRNLSSVGFLVLGSVNVSKDVSSIVGSYLVNGTFTDSPPGSGGGDTQLTVNGMIAARRFALLRQFRGTLENPQPSEKIIFDGRILANTPPGFEDLSKVLPVIRDVAP